MMHDVSMADVLFIILILGVVHGIMSWVSSLRKNQNSSVEENRNSPSAQS